MPTHPRLDTHTHPCGYRSTRKQQRYRHVSAVRPYVVSPLSFSGFSALHVSAEASESVYRYTVPQ